MVLLSLIILKLVDYAGFNSTDILYSFCHFSMCRKQIKGTHKAIQEILIECIIAQKSIGREEN